MRNDVAESALPLPLRYTRLVAGVGIGCWLAIAAFAAFPPPSTTARLLPQVGDTISRQFATQLPNGGTILFVSESCSVCVRRHKAYERWSVRSRDRLVVVERSSGGNIDMWQRVQRVGGRAVSVPAEHFRSQTGIVIVPAAVTVDSAGRVVNSRVSTIGRSRDILHPSSWIRAYLN
jgi:hypothetical protein